MDLLKSLVNEKKREREGATVEKGPAKWKRRGDIEKEKREKEEAERRRKEEEERAAKKKELEKLATASNKDEKVASGGEVVGEVTLAVKEVVRRLRALGEPIILFGESDVAREHRMLTCEREHHVNKDESMDGQRNIFHEADAADQLAEEQGQEHKEKYVDSEDDEVGVDNDPHWKFTIEYQVLVVFKKLLKEWEEYLDGRDESEKKSAQGRVDTVNFRETAKGIKTLLQKLRERTVPSDILPHVAEIVQHIKAREYVKANDCYLKVCIGNSPWPIGVTMVGIHERSAREKIFSQSVAHILNDEATRKYLFATKRLLTFAQKKYPTDPSRMIG